MNHGQNTAAYGLWYLVAANSAFFILFAFSFVKPKTKRDWRTFGTFSGFVIALFVEMYGFPLTIYLLSGWLTKRFPGLDPLNHDFGHLWYTLLGFKGNPHLNPIHIASNVIIVAGFFLLSAAWRVLFRAQQAGKLASTGPYAYVRHPQYVAFIAIMFGFLLQWPTLVTLVMFPILVIVYARLARKEERDVRAELGPIWDEYAAKTPAFLPSFRRPNAALRRKTGAHA